MSKKSKRSKKHNRSAAHPRAVKSDSQVERGGVKPAVSPTQGAETKQETAAPVAAAEASDAVQRPSDDGAAFVKSDDIIADYNGYDYKKIFWEEGGRDYEDAADRMAVRRLLPPAMDDFVDIAGGYGRLADEYLPRAQRATVFDYSQSELDQAKEIYHGRLLTKQGDIYKLPFTDDSFDALIMVRATHHFSDMQKVSDELYRILRPGGVAVVEVANKKTLPKMLRYLTKRSDVNPFDKNPSSLKDLNQNGFYNYHPKYIEEVFQKSGFRIEKVLSVSNFRSPKLKKIFGTKNLVRLEKGAQKLLAPVRFAPSIYYRLVKKSV